MIWIRRDHVIKYIRYAIHNINRKGSVCCKRTESTKVSLPQQLMSRPVNPKKKNKNSPKSIICKRKHCDMNFPTNSSF